jgi:type IV secretory pathway VirB2 component (pilin)
MNVDYQTNLEYFYQLVERVRGNVRRMAVAIGITTVGLIAMLLSQPWKPPMSARQLSAYLVIFVVSVGGVWFAGRMLRENRLLEAEAREIAEELDLEL